MPDATIEDQLKNIMREEDLHECKTLAAVMGDIKPNLEKLATTYEGQLNETLNKLLLTVEAVQVFANEAVALDKEARTSETHN